MKGKKKWIVCAVLVAVATFGVRAVAQQAPKEKRCCVMPGLWCSLAPLGQPCPPGEIPVMCPCPQPE